MSKFMIKYKKLNVKNQPMCAEQNPIGAGYCSRIDGHPGDHKAFWNNDNSDGQKPFLVWANEDPYQSVYGEDVFE